MNRHFTQTVATCLALGLAVLPALAQAGELKISGGGTATFDEMEGGTIFSVRAHLDADGPVSGHFFCAIPGVVAIVGDDLVDGTLNEDGSVTLFGFAHGFDAAVGVFEGMPFEVRLWNGGPGVGRFLYDDPVVGTNLVDTDVEGDRETVEHGRIRIVAR